MKIIDLLDESRVASHLTGTDTGSVLKELSELLARGGTGLDAGQVNRILLERERLGSTGIGDGVAIPHGKTRDLDRILASFGRAPAGVLYDAPDGRPVKLFFVLLAPDDSAGPHLKLLARIARLTRVASFRDQILAARDASEIHRIICDADAHL
jgi:PTS system nitrogen regulatory IIA component